MQLTATCRLPPGWLVCFEQFPQTSKPNNLHMQVALRLVRGISVPGVACHLHPDPFRLIFFQGSLDYDIAYSAKRCGDYNTGQQQEPHRIEDWQSRMTHQAKEHRNSSCSTALLWSAGQCSYAIKGLLPLPTVGGCNIPVCSEGQAKASRVLTTSEAELKDIQLRACPQPLLRSTGQSVNTAR